MINKSIMKLIINILALIIMAAQYAKADNEPTINPTAKFIATTGDEQEGIAFSGSAPVKATLSAGTENADGWNAYYEWRFYRENEKTPYIIRYEENTDYVFNTSGTHLVKLYATFTQGNDTVRYGDEYWLEARAITVSISESKLEMPNAFSPNGDDINDIYKPMSNYQSIVDFHAYIFNRWGQKLFEWTDPSKGWDGTYNGNAVKQGVYFCRVRAKGADGRVFDIKTDVNLLRGFTETTTTN
jgi:gliding motility-associated-like protein